MLNRAIVTGANGFIASNLVQRLLALGWSVTGVHRSKPGRELGHKGYHEISWEEFWKAEPPGETDVVFHLAGYVPANMEDSACASLCLEANALLALRLAEHVAIGKARLINASSGQGYLWQKQPASEDLPLFPSGRGSIYLSSKLLGEIYVERTRLVKGLNAVTFRIGSCYGPGMSSNSLIARFSNAVRQGQPMHLRHGGMEQFDCVYVGDVVECMVRAASSDAKEIYNLGSGTASTVKDIATTVLHVFGGGAEIIMDDGDEKPLQPGFAPLCMKRCSETFGIMPHSLEEGVLGYKQWLEQGGPQ